VLKVPGDAAFQPEAIIDVVAPFEDTHCGKRQMTVRDPDGRIWRLHAPANANNSP